MKWTVGRADGASAGLELKIGGPNAWQTVRFTIDGRPVTVFEDGRGVEKVRKPDAREPRREVDLRDFGIPTVVVLEWRPEWTRFLRVDVFQDEVSIVDGRSLAQSRAGAPAPGTAYDSRMWSVQRSLLGWGTVNTLFVGFCGLMGSTLYRGGPVDWLVIVLTMAWIGGLCVFLSAVNHYNLNRRSLGAARWLLFFGSAVIYPLVSFLALTAVFGRA